MLYGGLLQVGGECDLRAAETTQNSLKCWYIYVGDLYSSYIII